LINAALRAAASKTKGKAADEKSLTAVALRKTLGKELQAG
jgi:hypothetical protein